MNLFFYVILSAFVVGTIHLVIMKNDLDKKWNDSFGLRLGNFCFLCVSFWLGCLLTWGLHLKVGFELYEFTLSILSIPSLTMLIIKPFYHD